MCVCAHEKVITLFPSSFTVMIFFCAGLWLLFTIFIIHIVRKHVTERYVTPKAKHEINHQPAAKFVYQHQTSVNSIASLQTVIYNPTMSSGDEPTKSSSSPPRFEETIITQSLRPKSNSSSSSSSDSQLLHPQVFHLIRWHALELLLILYFAAKN